RASRPRAPVAARTRNASRAVGWRNRQGLSAIGESRAAADAHAVAQSAAPSTPGGPAAVLAAARQVLDEAARRRPPLELDYVALVDPADFTEVRPGHTGEAVLAVAAKVGSTRLIDNIPLTFGAAI
ncbi:pantoate--beta-alanine ligase, partial [Streptomyces huasconensis]|uniref:pantoate--beta-alanine ligase n=1 Tax=Streptomyces huasconensis TaxID=1854574 RepID=UPI0033C87AA1